MFVERNDIMNKMRIVSMIACAATLMSALSGCGATKTDFSIAKELIPGSDQGLTITDKLTETNKPIGDHNPVSSNVFFADPTAVEYEGRLYVYGTNDQQEFDNKSGMGENSYGSINSLVCYSTADMVNWTYHGVIPVTEICTWAGCSWAPSIASKKNALGKTEFFLYFCNSAGGVGVLKSDSPTGPWKDPIGKPLVAPNTNELAEDPVFWCFDPGVVVDENGVGWLAFGGGDPMHDGENSLYTGNSRIVRLGDDMTSLDSEIVCLKAPYHFEANELNYINGTYVLTYCSNWSPRDLWPMSLKQPESDVCTMVYMVSKDPLNPDSWEYKGQYLANPTSHGYPFSNNHSHLQKFNDKYYLFYQNVSLLENMQSTAGGFRSIGVDECIVDEETVTFTPASMTDAGVEQIKNFDVFSVTPAETGVTTAGVTFYGDDERTYVTKISDGDWTAISNADFGEGANAFAATVRGKGIIEVRLDAPDGKTVGSLQFNSEDGKFQTFVCDLNKTVSGVHDLYLVFNGNFVFDEWQFAYIVEEEPAE